MIVQQLCTMNWTPRRVTLTWAGPHRPWQLIGSGSSSCGSSNVSVAPCLAAPSTEVELGEVVSAGAADNAFWQHFAFADMSPGTIAIVLGLGPRAEQAVPRRHRAGRERQLTTHANCLVWLNFCVARPVWRQSARIGLQLISVLLWIERAGNFCVVSLRIIVFPLPL